MDLGGEERDRAEHHDDETEAGELGEEAKDQPQSAGGLGDREDAEPGQHAGGHLVRRLSAPQASLGQAVEEKDGAEGEAEDEERDVGELVEPEEEAHVVLKEEVPGKLHQSRSFACGAQDDRRAFF